jgi:hypothetical protein
LTHDDSRSPVARGDAARRWRDLGGIARRMSLWERMCFPFSAEVRLESPLWPPGGDCVRMR